MFDKKIRDWLWPGFICGLSGFGWWYAVEVVGTQAWQFFIALIFLISLAAMIANFLEYLTERKLALLDRQNSVLTYSSDVRLFEAARGLAAQSPELAAEMARKVGRPDLILFQSRQGRQAVARLAGSDVTIQFAMRVLELSDDIHMAAMRNFADGTFKYDPNKELSDRDQWKQLNWIWSQEGMVTRYVPNEATHNAPMWLPPWNPVRVRDFWLMPGELRETLKTYLEESVEASDDES